MSVLFFDGCGEYYSTSQLVDVWTVFGAPTVTSTGGRNNGAYIHFPNGAFITKVLDINYQEVIVGFGLRSAAFAEGSDILGFFNGSTLMVSIEMTAAGGLKVMRGGSVEIGATTNALLQANAWHYIEVRLKVDNAPNGEIEIWIDGVQRLLDNAVDSLNGTDATFDALTFQEFIQPWDMDDVYVLDPNSGAASPHNTFLGDIQIDAVVPDGVGAHEEFDTAVGSVNHWQNVDEIPHTGDTDYNESPTVNDRDLFTFGDLPAISGGSTLLSVKATALVRKIDAGLGQFRLVARPVATNRNGDTLTLSTEYRYHQHIWDLNPETSAAWTDALFNASEFGVEVL